MRITFKKDVGIMKALSILASAAAVLIFAQCGPEVEQAPGEDPAPDFSSVSRVDSARPCR